MNDKSIGASIGSGGVTPSINLASIANLLKKSIEQSEQGAKPLLSVDSNGSLIVNTIDPLGYLLDDSEFRNELSGGQSYKADTAFIQNVVMPGLGKTARVGCQLPLGSEMQTTKRIDALHELIRGLIEKSVPVSVLSNLCELDFDSLIGNIGKRLGEKPQKLPDQATIVPVSFSSGQETQSKRNKDLAVLFSAVETIDAEDWLSVLLGGIRRRLERNELEADEIDDILESISDSKDLPGSLVRRFLDFLDDDALSRVRLQVSIALMRAIAHQSKTAAMREYVRRVDLCFKGLSLSIGKPIEIDASALYGTGSVSTFGEHLEKVMFYSNLPVWPKWSTQIVEGRSEHSSGFSTVREVSYGFRINGVNPKVGKPAFLARLDQLEKELNLDAETLDARIKENPRVKTALAQLMFLWLVIPDGKDSDENFDLEAMARRVVGGLKSDTAKTLKYMLEKLRERSHVVDLLAKDLVAVNKAKSSKVLQATSHEIQRFTVSVKSGVINWEAIDSGLSNGASEILIGSELANPKTEWYKHLMVYNEINAGGSSLASYHVGVQIKETVLTQGDQSISVKFDRNLSRKSMLVRMIPFFRSKNAEDFTADVPDPSFFSSGREVQILYRLAMLKMSVGRKGDQKLAAEQLRTASICSMALLMYVVLFELLAYAKRQGLSPSVSIIRLQKTGKADSAEEDARDGNTAIYAISHAIQQTLAREANVYIQGVTTNAEQALQRWRTKGAYQALVGGHPIRYPVEGPCEKVALIVYSIRPCDDHPQFADQKKHLLCCMSYTATKTGGVMELKAEKMDVSAVNDVDKSIDRSFIFLEIKRLYEQGYRDIVVLSNQFGSRRIGGTAERHSHLSREFFNRTDTDVPDANIYSLRREVFPATRIRKRSSHESAFEVHDYSGHQALCDNQGNMAKRSLMPIYTFATLNVVGEDLHPQSGFCTYFFDSETRVADISKRERVRQNILGDSSGKSARASILSMLRGVHFMESQKPTSKGILLPVLDPYSWATPGNAAHAGEVVALTSRRNGEVSVSILGMLSAVADILHRKKA